MRKPLLTLTVCLLLAVAGGARAGEDLTAMTNAERTEKGLQRLVTAGDLQSFAQRRADDMARAGKLWHSEDLGSRISNWKRVGENIGRGPNVTNIQRNFMASPEHRDNILFPQFSEIGVGVAEGKGYVYVSVVFREPAAAPSPRPAPTPPPAPRPAPVARPRLAAAAPKPRPKPAPAPTTTTTTTIPPAPVAAPEPPAPEPVLETPRAAPLEVAVQPVFQARPVFENPDFQAINFQGDPLVPQPPTRQPDSPLLPATARTVLGLIGVFGGVHRARLRWRRGRSPDL